MVVDVEDTGEMKENYKWFGGLHEFLEMKHKLNQSHEGLVKFYQSNHKFFAQYGGNIIGLTGTLGSEMSRTFLEEVYSVDTYNVPTFNHKWFVQFPPLLCDRNWEAKVIENALEVISQNRPVLIILQNIYQAKKVSAKLTK